MSLLNFPPLNAKGRPYALQEYNGQILTGSKEEFRSMAKSTFLNDYPSIERQNLNSLQHCLSKDDMRSAFVFREQDKLSAAFQIWNKEGASGVVEHLANASETSNLWPLSRAGRAILRMRNGVANMAQKMLPSQTQEGFEDKLVIYAPTLNWKQNWVRCVSWHNDGKRLALAQNNDYIRIYTIGQGAPKAPLTLRHADQRNVTTMAWLPFDQRVLAVAAGGNIIVWRLNAKTSNIKVSTQCAQVINVCSGPLASLIWDRTSSQTLLAASPNSNKIYLVDVSSGEVESVGAWTGGSITGLYPSDDGQRVAVTYTGNNIRVYDRNNWRDEKWSGLAGRATSAIWSASGDCLLFSTENDFRIFVIHFTAKTGQNSEGQIETRWYGSSKAMPIFDVSPVEFDASELEIEGGVLERDLVRMGGAVHRMVLSPDSQRLAVQFRDNRSVIALFIVEWKPSVQLMPCGLIEAPGIGDATIITFIPKFDAGSMLNVVWSGGYVQYIPMVYGHSTAAMIHSGRSLLEEYSASTPTLDQANQSATEGASESLISAEFPSGIVDSTRAGEEPEKEIVLFSERLRTPAPTTDVTTS